MHERYHLLVSYKNNRTVKLLSCRYRVQIGLNDDIHLSHELNSIPGVMPLLGKILNLGFYIITFVPLFISTIHVYVFTPEKLIYFVMFLSLTAEKLPFLPYLFFGSFYYDFAAAQSRILDWFDTYFEQACWLLS